MLICLVLSRGWVGAGMNRTERRYEPKRRQPSTIALLRSLEMIKRNPALPIAATRYNSVIWWLLGTGGSFLAPLWDIYDRTIVVMEVSTKMAISFRNQRLQRRPMAQIEALYPALPIYALGSGSNGSHGGEKFILYLI